MALTEGPSKGGQNPDNTSDVRPPVPGGSVSKRGNMNAYFMGCWSPRLIGHYLYDIHGNNVARYVEQQFPISYRCLDGGLLNGIPKVEGNAVLFHGRGWGFLSFWDSSGDKRPGSTSTFIMPREFGFFTFDEAVETAKALFPQRWALIQFPIVECK